MSQAWFCNRKIYRVRKKESVSERWRDTRKESEGITVKVSIIFW